MVKTSILIEVDQRVNDLVVVPHKRNKTFSKLMASLLQGYLEDDYIRAYAEGTLEDMRKASVDVLDDALNSMTMSLSNMGIYGSELKNSNSRGMEHFKKYSEEKSNEIREREEFSSNNEEVEELKSAVGDLKKQNEAIMDMLKSLTSGMAIEKVETPSIEPPKVEIQEPEVVEVQTKEVTQPIVEEPTVLQESAISVVDEDEEDDDSGIDASSLLGSLMSGNQYSF